MPDVDSTRTKSHEALDLGIVIVWTEVDVESVLDGLGFRHEREQKPGRSVDVGPNLELIWVGVHDDPSQCDAPPTSEVDRRDRVDDHLLPREAHPIKLPLQGERRWSILVLRPDLFATDGAFGPGRCRRRGASSVLDHPVALVWVYLRCSGMVLRCPVRSNTEIVLVEIDHWIELTMHSVGLARPSPNEP